MSYKNLRAVTDGKHVAYRPQALDVQRRETKENTKKIKNFIIFGQRAQN
jgi:hypothetical protein